MFRANRVLLGRRASSRTYYPGVWDLFGGHVHAGESPAVALVRELSEELGIEAVVGAPLRVAPEPSPGAHGPGEFHIFLVRRWRGEPTLRNAEHDAIGWFTLAEAAELELADPAILRVIEEVAPWDDAPDSSSKPTPLRGTG